MESRNSEKASEKVVGTQKISPLHVKISNHFEYLNQRFLQAYNSLKDVDVSCICEFHGWYHKIKKTLSNFLSCSFKEDEMFSVICSCFPKCEKLSIVDDFENDLKRSFLLSSSNIYGSISDNYLAKDDERTDYIKLKKDLLICLKNLATACFEVSNACLVYSQGYITGSENEFGSPLNICKIEVNNCLNKASILLNSSEVTKFLETSQFDVEKVAKTLNVDYIRVCDLSKD